MSTLVIKGARVIDPANAVDRIEDLHIVDGRIAALGAPPPGREPDRVVEATGRWIVPGVVDLAARLRQPGQEHKGTIASETLAAASSGITTLCTAPDTDPIVDSPAEVELINRLAGAAGRSRVVTIGALTAGLKGSQLSEMAALKNAGCVGVGNALAPLASTLVLRRAMEYAASHDLTLFLHPLDHALANEGCAHEGAVASRLGLPGIPEAAETAALGQLLALVEHTGVRAHFCRLSTARAVRTIGRARYDGLPVSADVCAHQLFLTEMDVADFNSLCHTLPPLRTERDRDGLREAVATGVVDAICSDHQPHEVDAKLAPFPATEPGISALETLLPLTLRLVDEGVLTLPDAIARLTIGPARILGLDAGALSVGAAADLCILDPDYVWELEPESMLSHGRNTPFAGWEFKGRVVETLVGGRSVYSSD
ncbi:MAG: dihydroorotase [Chromatiales bacterium]